MPLIALTQERIRVELERCEAGERAHRSARRQVWMVAGSIVAGNVLQVALWGLSFHLVGDAAQAAKAAAQLCAPVPAIVLVLWQLRREP